MKNENENKRVLVVDALKHVHTSIHCRSQSVQSWTTNRWLEGIPKDPTEANTHNKAR